jgi:hypothetical protein
VASEPYRSAADQREEWGCSAAIVSYFVYRAQADPEVLVYVAPDEGRQMTMVLVIENIGKAPAHDVTSQLSEPIPQGISGG